MASIQKIDIPAKLCPIFEGAARYRGAHGGRGSGKTQTFATMAALRGAEFAARGEHGVILCAREHLNSLDESSLQEVKSAIARYPFLAERYEVGEKYVRTKCGTIRFVFAGLRHNLDSIKSKARIKICWVDEAENVVESAWQKLLPTVREEGSEIWITWNPENKHSATNQRFKEFTPDNAKIVEINYCDNPFFPDVLEKERLNDLRDRPDQYEHIWLGQYKTITEGAYYANEIRQARSDDRINDRVRYDPALPVVTAWDLGVGDSTAIWFAQYIGSEIRLIDYYEASGAGLDHYIQVLNEKGYIYGEHILPHDARVRELGTGKSRIETLQRLGMSNIQIAPQLRIDDGIQSVRSMLATCWFNSKTCERGIECLQSYRREYNEVMQVWKERPLHDFSSHAADAFRYLATGKRNNKSRWNEPIKRGLKGVA